MAVVQLQFIQLYILYNYIVIKSYRHIYFPACSIISVTFFTFVDCSFAKEKKINLNQKWWFHVFAPNAATTEHQYIKPNYPFVEYDPI